MNWHAAVCWNFATVGPHEIVPAEKIARVRAIYLIGLAFEMTRPVAAYFADANLALDALEVAPDRLKPLRG